MNRLLAIFAVLLVSWVAEAQSTNNVITNDVVRLRVTVLDVAALRGFTGSLTPTGDIFPRFALTVRIDSTIPAITNLESGTVVTIAVHSPSLFLGGSAEKGKTHEITMPRKKAMNLVSEHRTKQANQTDAVSPAIASGLHSEHQWRGVTDPERSACFGTLPLKAL